MRLVILGMNYAPELTGIAPYTTGLAEALASKGHHVSVLTSFPHYPRWTFTPEDARRWWQVEERHGVRVLRTKVLLPRRGSAISRIAYDSSLVVGALVQSLRVHAADVVLCISPPIQLALGAVLLARRWHAPLALLIKDLPLDAALAVGLMRPGRALSIARHLEHAAYKHCNRIIVISEGFRQHLLRQGVPAEQIVEIPDWVDTHAIQPRSADPAVRQLLGAGVSDFLVLHTGNQGQKQALAHAIRATAHVPSTVRLQFTLVGDGSERRSLEGLAQQINPTAVHFLPLQPSELFPQILAAADALLLNQRANVTDSVAPSKLLSYMAAGRPVLAAVHECSEAARVLTDANCGLLTPPEDPAALAQGITQLATNPTLRAELAANGRRFVIKHYERELVLQQYESLLLALASSGHHSNHRNRSI